MVPTKLSCTPVPHALTAQGSGNSFTVAFTHLKLEQGFSTKQYVQSFGHTTLQVTHNVQWQSRCCPCGRCLLPGFLVTFGLWALTLVIRPDSPILTSQTEEGFYLIPRLSLFRQRRGLFQSEFESTSIIMGAGVVCITPTTGMDLLGFLWSLHKILAWRERMCFCWLWENGNQPNASVRNSE